MKSRQEKCKEYWFNREMENTRKSVREEKEFSRYLETTYRSALKDIEDDINRFYVKYSTDEGISIAETKKRVKAIDMEEFEAKAKKYVKEKDFTDQANAEMKLYNLGMKLNRLELLKAEINLELINLGSNVEKSVRDKLTEASMQEFERQAGILGKSVTNPRHKAEVIASGSFHNASFDDRIWGNLHIFRNSLETILERSFLKGEHPRKMIPKLKKAFGASTYEANRLAVTEMARVQAEAQMESFKRNGFEQYMFHDTDGSRTCEHCRALDGKVFDVEKMAVGDNAPPLHPHCRCSVSAYEDSDDYEAWLDHLANGGSTKTWQAFKRSGAKTETASKKNETKPKKVSKSKFVEASSIEEAESYASKFVDSYKSKSTGNVDYSKIDLKFANDMNKAFTEVLETYKTEYPLRNIKPFNTREKRFKGVTAEAAYQFGMGDLFYNKAYYKNQKAFDKHMSEYKTLSEQVMPNIDMLIEKYSSDDSYSGKIQYRYLKALKNTKRTNVYAPDAYGSTIHELGHYLDDNMFFSYNKKRGFDLDESFDKYAGNISAYATSNKQEYIAESFAAYWKGEEDILDPEILKMFKELQNAK